MWKQLFRLSTGAPRFSMRIFIGILLKCKTGRGVLFQFLHQQKNWNQDRYYPETLTGTRTGRKAIEPHYPKQFQDQKNGYAAHSALSQFSMKGSGWYPFIPVLVSVTHTLFHGSRYLPFSLVVLYYYCSALL